MRTHRPAARRLAAIFAAGALTALISATAFAARGDIYTIAGDLWRPSGVAGTADGAVLIADTHYNRILRVAPDGTVTTVAGSLGEEREGFAGDGGPAVDANLYYPYSVAALPDGGFLFVDGANGRVRRVFPDGTIDTVAGGGHNGNGCKATRASLDGISGISLTGDGGFLVADYDNAQIRRVWPDGSITRVAGEFNATTPGDEGPALQVRLSHPGDVAATEDGGFLIADTANDRIRRVDAQGMVHTVAGKTRSGFSGDGGPSTEATLDRPYGVAALATGGFLIADTYNRRIREVTPAGTISTVAGSGESIVRPYEGWAGEGGPAIAGRLSEMMDVTAAPRGGILIADTLNDGVRFVDSTHLPVQPRPASAYQGTGGYTGSCLGLDPSFSGGSVLTTHGATGADGLVIQSDGKIVIAGTDFFHNYNRNFVLHRYLPNGQLDDSFGNSGKAVTNPNLDISAYLVGLEEQPTEGHKLVIAGSFSSGNSQWHTVVARFTREGVHDPSFGNNGFVRDPPNVDEGYAVKLDVAGDGKVVVASACPTRTGLDTGCLIRYTKDGALDPSFGHGGVAQARLGPPAALSVMDDGSVLVAGGGPRDPATGHDSIWVSHYREDGDPDSDFGDAGRAHLSVPFETYGLIATAIVVQPDGRIVVGGREEHYEGGRQQQDILIARLLRNGELDSSFSGDGVTLFAPRMVRPGHQLVNTSALALQSDGKIVFAGGGSDGTWAGGKKFVVGRLTVDGELDPSFAPGGMLMTPMGSAGEAKALAVEQDGRIVAAGTADIWAVGIARYNPLLPAGAPPVQSGDTTPTGELIASGSKLLAADMLGATRPSAVGGPPRPLPIPRRIPHLKVTAPRLPSLFHKKWRLLVRSDEPGIVRGTLTLPRSAFGRAGRAWPRRRAIARGSATLDQPGLAAIVMHPTSSGRRFARRGVRRLTATLRVELRRAGIVRSATTQRIRLRR